MSHLARQDSHGRFIRRCAPALVALTAACTDGFGFEPQVIWLTPALGATLAVGDTLSMTATIQGRSPCACRWGSSNGAVAPVSPEGLVRAVAPGKVSITARFVRDSTVENSVLIIVAER